MSAAVPGPEAHTATILERLRGSPLILLLDVDGTLAPIAPRPDAAAVPPETRAVLAALVALPDTHVALVSGRAAADALRMVGIPTLAAAGNHGFELITPLGGSRAHPAAAPYHAALAGALSDLRAALQHIPGAIVEDKALTISVHYRLVDAAHANTLRSTVDQIAAARGLRAGGGKLIVELRPPVDVHKGTAVLALVEELGGGGPAASILFAGDDVTDEDAFEHLRAHHAEAVTVHVGDRAKTAAEFRVASALAFRELLAAVHRSRSG